MRDTKLLLGNEKATSRLISKEEYVIVCIAGSEGKAFTGNVMLDKATD